MSVALAVLVVLGFVLVAKRAGVLERGRMAGIRARGSLRVLSDRTLDDDAKEALLREEARGLFKLFFQINAALGLALVVPMAGVALLSLAGIGSFADTLTILSRADFLLGATALSVVAWAALPKK